MRIKTIGLFCFLIFSKQLTAQIAEKAEDISPLLVGETLPDVNLRDLKGNFVKLYDILKNKKTVLVFYRGSWCPFCNAQLAALAMSEDEILSEGYQIVAVSPDDYQNLQPMMDKNEIKYHLYSDPKGNLIQKTGLAFQLSKERIESLSKRTLGEVTEILPVPTVMVVNPKAEILFEYINPNYRNRISPSLLMAVLKNL